MLPFNKRITKALIRLRGCADWSAVLLFANPEDGFSRVEAQNMLQKICLCHFILYSCGDSVRVFQSYNVYVRIWYQFFACARIWYRSFTYMMIGTDSSHVITRSRFVMVLILHMCKDFVLVIYICEVLVPIPHICEDLLLIYIYIYILLCFPVKNLITFRKTIVPVHIKTVLKEFFTVIITCQLFTR